MTKTDSRRFSVKRGQRIASVFYVAVFAAWTAISAYVLFVAPSKSVPHMWPATVITVGVPLGMLCLSVYFMLQMLSTIEVDSVGVRLSGPIGGKAFTWKEAVRYDLAGTEASGIRVFASSGVRMDISFPFFEDGDDLRDLVLPQLPIDDGQEPLVSVMQGRAAINTILLGLMGFLIAAGIAIKDMDSSYWVVVVLLAAISLPIVAYGMTYQVRLVGDILSTTSCFGSKRIHVGAETRIEVKQLVVKNGRIWQLTASDANGTKIKLNGRTSRFTAFRSRLMNLSSHETSAQ